MDQETFQSLLTIFKIRPSADLLSILIDEAGGEEKKANLLAVLAELPPANFSARAFEQVKTKTIEFSLSALDIGLADRLSSAPKTSEEKVQRARVLHKLGRASEAWALYLEAVGEKPSLKSREVERSIGLRPGSNATLPAAKIISLNTYAVRSKSGIDRREQQLNALLDDLDETAITFADIGGLDPIKAEIRRRIVLPYLKPTLFERFKREPGGNILIYGPPGCGKTMIARATASESDARFFPVKPEDILDRYAGDAEKRLRMAFDEARSETPSILFFDDFEILAHNGGEDQQNDIAPALISTLLSELDAHERGPGGVLVLCATNAPWCLDPAFFRAGRFHRALFAGLPDMGAREFILKRHLTALPGGSSVDYGRIAKKSAGLTGAEIKALCDWVSDRTLTAQLDGNAGAAVTSALLEQGLRLIPPLVSNWIRQAEQRFKAKLPTELHGLSQYLFRV